MAQPVGAGGDLGGGVEALQHLLPEALGLLQARRIAIKHHDQICGAA